MAAESRAEARGGREHITEAGRYAALVAPSALRAEAQGSPQVLAPGRGAVASKDERPRIQKESTDAPPYVLSQAWREAWRGVPAWLSRRAAHKGIRLPTTAAPLSVKPRRRAIDTTYYNDLYAGDISPHEHRATAASWRRTSARTGEERRTIRGRAASADASP